MRGIERLDEQIEHAAASQSEAEDQIVAARRIVGDEPRRHVREPHRHALGDVALQTPAADRAGERSILADHRPRSSTAIRRSLRTDHGHQHASFAGVDQRTASGDDFVDLVHRKNRERIVS